MPTADRPIHAASPFAAPPARVPWLLELGVFAIAAVFVVASAVKAKRAEFGPLLAAVESSSAQPDRPAPIKLVAATREPTRDQVTTLDATPTLADSPPDTSHFGLGSLTPQPGAQRYFDARPIRVKKTIWMTVTAYSPDERSCGKWADGRTATNHSVWTNGMRLVAADPTILPYGSLLSIPGYAQGDTVPVLDCGGAIKGARLDLLFATHAEARRWGVKKLKVTVWEYADKAD